MKADFSKTIQGLLENKDLGHFARHEILWFVVYKVKFESN